MNVIITGASRGIGKAIAEEFAAAGHDLCLCARGELSLYRTVEELVTRFEGVTVKARPYDLEDPLQAQAFGKWILDLGLSVDILVNNAGQFLSGHVLDEPAGTLEKMIGANLYSAYHLTRTLAPAMIARHQGHIFNICSVASLQAYENGGSYSISKFALAGFSSNLRQELKPHGVKVTTVYPGAAMTDSWSGSGVDPSRIMKARDIAQMILAASLLSPQATVEEILIRPQLGDL